MTAPTSRRALKAVDAKLSLLVNGEWVELSGAGGFMLELPDDRAAQDRALDDAARLLLTPPASFDVNFREVEAENPDSVRISRLGTDHGDFAENAPVSGNHSETQ